jgi:hypothetical protein
VLGLPSPRSSRPAVPGTPISLSHRRHRVSRAIARFAHEYLY